MEKTLAELQTEEALIWKDVKVLWVWIAIFSTLMFMLFASAVGVVCRADAISGDIVWWAVVLSSFCGTCFVVSIVLIIACVVDLMHRNDVRAAIAEISKQNSTHAKEPLCDIQHDEPQWQS